MPHPAVHGLGWGIMQWDIFDVRLEGSRIEVQAYWRVPWPRAWVFSVLMDFERMPAWMPRLEESVVLDRTPQRMRVRQVGRFLGLSLAVDLEVRWVEPERIEFAQIRGSFDRFEGVWTLQALEDVPEGTRIGYELKAAHPLARLAVWISPYVRTEVQEQLEGLDAYMRRLWSPPKSDPSPPPTAGL
jgi:ribosome-associated toxin RatA of RatAB toxin-antitoxin module